jgi:hypothetical protein
MKMKLKILAIKDASFTDLKCTFNKRHNIYGTVSDCLKLFSNLKLHEV